MLLITLGNRFTCRVYSLYIWYPLHFVNPQRDMHRTTITLSVQMKPKGPLLDLLELQTCKGPFGIPDWNHEKGTVKGES